MLKQIKAGALGIDLLHKCGTGAAGVVLQQVDLKRYGKLGYGDSGYYCHFGLYKSHFNN